MVRSFRGGQMRSKQRRRAVVSPSKASSLAFWTRASPSLLISSSKYSVDLLRLPIGRPAAFPLDPRGQRPSVWRFSALFFLDIQFHPFYICPPRAACVE